MSKVEAEYIAPDESSVERNDFGRIPSNVLFQTGFPESDATVRPYECDNCGTEYKCDVLPKFCLHCGVSHMDSEGATLLDDDF